MANTGHFDTIVNPDFVGSDSKNQQTLFNESESSARSKSSQPLVKQTKNTYQDENEDRLSALSVSAHSIHNMFSDEERDSSTKAS